MSFTVSIYTNEPIVCDHNGEIIGEDGPRGGCLTVESPSPLAPPHTLIHMSWSFPSTKHIGLALLRRGMKETEKVSPHRYSESRLVTLTDFLLGDERITFSCRRRTLWEQRWSLRLFLLCENWYSFCISLVSL